MLHTDQVETLLKNQELAQHNDHEDSSRRHSSTADSSNITQQASPNASDDDLGAGRIPTSYPDPLMPGDFEPENTNVHSGEDDFPWEMIGLNLDEPLPPQDTISKL